MENKKNRIFDKYPKVTLFIIYFVLVSLSLLIVEVICHILLKRVLNKRSYDLVFNLNVQEDCDQSYFDPLLGYAHSKCTDNNIKQISSFVIYDSKLEKDITPIKIVTLGGSTTDPILYLDDSRIGSDNWPKLLRDRCEAKQLACVIFNGGSGGFSSSQELLKLIRDVQPLKPDLVVSLNGINEWHFGEARVGRYPYLSKYQQNFALQFVTNGQSSRLNSDYKGNLLNRFMPNFRKVIDSYSIQNIGKAIDDSSAQTSAIPWTSETSEVREVFDSLNLNFGSAYDFKPWDIWYRNVKLMHSISNTLGIKYYVFLQPTMGVGHYEYSAQDLAMKEERNDVYYSSMNELYKQLQLKCSNLDFCIDLSNVFQGQSNLYMDPRHPNAEGNGVQAKAIFNVLARDGHFDIRTKK